MTDDAEQLAEFAALVEQADQDGATAENEAGRPEWLAAKFANVEEAARGQAAAEQAMTRASQEAAQLREELQATRQSFEEFLVAQEAQAFAEGGVYDHEREGDFGDFGLPAEATDPVDRLVALQQVTAAAVRDAAGAPPPNPDAPFEHVVSALAERFDDFMELQPRIMQTLQENPAVLGADPAAVVNDPVQLQAALAAAYVSVKNADAQNGANRQMKMQAQTLSGPSGRPEPESGDDAYVRRIFNADMGRYK